MALFSTKKQSKDTDLIKKDKVATSVKASASVAKKSNDVSNMRVILKGARITEKAILLNDKNIYVFNVAINATKSEIKQAIKQFHKVEPIDIKVVTIPTKTKRRGNSIGKTKQTKKAYVRLKPGQTIELT